jgi:hypothetical protein
MGVDDSIKRKAEEDYFEAAREAERRWEYLDRVYGNQDSTEIISTFALVAIAAELRATRKSRY